MIRKRLQVLTAVALLVFLATLASCSRQAAREVAVNLWPDNVREFSPSSSSDDARPWCPVSLTPLGKHQYLMANYNKVILFDSRSGSAKTMQIDKESLPARGEGWIHNPAGLFFSPAVDGLFVANYTANNLVVYKVDEKAGTLRFLRVITSAHTISPENVWVSEKGDLCVCANYDGSSVTAFDISSYPARELWNTPIKLAHGVCMSRGKVYATGLMDKCLFELDRSTGRIMRQAGRAGWRPGEMEFLWPTSVQPLSEDQLIVSDAHTGFIYFIDATMLKVSTYFGGNGPTYRFLNMPYTAIVNEEELVVASAFQNRLLCGDRKNLTIDRVYACNAKEWAYTREERLTTERLGAGWEKYIWEKGPRVSILGQDFLLGYAQLHPAYRSESLPVLNTPYPASSLFNGGGELYFLDRVQLESGFILFSNQKPQAYYFFRDDAQYLFPLTLEQDSWCMGNTLCSPLRKVQLKRLEGAIRQKAARLKAKRLTTGLLVADDLRRIMFPGLSGPLFHQKLRELFTTPQGRVFYEEYQEAEKGNRGKKSVDAMAQNYFCASWKKGNNSLDELMVVHMLTGREPGAINGR
ncbi:MAG: beta-propeller fold lactonase family protein [Candidatus Eremiobacteraeota bacterium]|nr:beta-propeller fold lactonase family protein [Candidatus Eremiobacteraeota bacterium]